MVGAIFVLVILAVTVLVAFWVGIVSIFLGISAGIGESSWGIFVAGLVVWALAWGGSAWALYGFISTLVGLFQ